MEKLFSVIIHFPNGPVEGPVYQQATTASIETNNILWLQAIKTWE